MRPIELEKKRVACSICPSVIVSEVFHFQFLKNGRKFIAIE
jgi:hypothetical protein